MKRLLLLIILISNYTYGQVINKPQHDPPEIINKYTEVLFFNECNNAITVSNDSSFNIGDTVLLIQMKGAVIDSSNTASFGTILDYKNAGNYEFNYISQKSGNKLTFKNRLTKTYDIPGGVVQLIRVPYYTNPNFSGGLTCLPWDGTKGGVLAVIANGVLNSSAEIDITGRGFRGGEGYNAILPASNCFENNYNYSAASQLAGYKGESIASISQNINKGKGSPASGGGGGLSHNSGGGGGANAGAGGYGGYQTDTCGNAPFDNRGVGGKNLIYTAAANKIFMGGGGGAGHADNTSINSQSPGGGAGGGIVIIITDSLNLNNYEIYANGANGSYCYSSDCNDGMGGGGAGGSVLLSVIKVIDILTVQALGGDGGNGFGKINTAGKAGPGGGGGGGTFFINSSTLPINISTYTTAGNSGVIITNPNDSWGATKGTNGLSFFNLVLPFDTVLFKPNIDSVRIKDSLISCNSFGFKGMAFTNTNPITSWSWNFGDGNTALTQNVTHTYLSQNSFLVKLTATDINGCKDSITDIVNPKNANVDAGMNNSFCSDIPISIALNGTGTGIFSWTPAIYLNDPAQQDPIATIDTTTTFYLTVTEIDCANSDSVKIIINHLPNIKASKSNDINCNLPFAKLNVSGALQYVWAPSSFLSNSIIANPIANPTTSTNFIVTGTDTNGCSSKDSIDILVDFDKKGIMLPNSFTPNGDGLNDCFGIRYYRDVQNLVFIIYNRFGEKVFETKNAAVCWDGNYKGQQLDPGTYVYYLNAKTLCGDVIKKGSILLIR